MSVLISGACLSGGDSKLLVSHSDKFSLYIHKDSQKSVCLPLNIQNIYVKNHLVYLGIFPRVKVVEHLFSALYGLGLFNVKIELSGDEIPFFDGSSQEFARVLRKIAKGNNCNVLKLNKKIFVREENSFIRYEPIGDDLVIEMALSHPYIKTQKIILKINQKNYLKEIAPARTFVFTDEDDPRLRNLPPYGIGITKSRSYCATPLRFSDELVRHKILDLLGDLYVWQRSLSGKITCRNTSHQLNFKFVRMLKPGITKSLKDC